MPGTKMMATALAITTLAATPAFVAPAMAQQTTAPATVSQAELDAFAVAYRNVLAIDQEYAAQVQQANDEAEKQAIVDEAQLKMAEAVEDAPDIEVDRYIEIIQLVQNDPDLQARLTAKLQG